MRLCFGTFANVLLKNRSNKAVNRNMVGQTLVDFIDPHFLCDGSCLYKLLDRSRDLTADLVRVELDTADLCDKFQKYTKDYLSKSHNLIFLDFFNLILSDESLTTDVKTDLIKKTKLQGADLPQFLAEIFLFVIKYTNNELKGTESPSIAPRPEAEERVLYVEMALCAVKEKNLEILDFALTNQENNIYLEACFNRAGNERAVYGRTVFYRGISSQFLTNHQ
ncbi:MAG: hypothetical protein LBJ12_04900 [Oscillospiraceae bacterium]|nr:hypothetical protein [Oscillospiraceae bacterium]